MVINHPDTYKSNNRDMTTPWSFVMRLIATINFRRDLNKKSETVAPMKPMKITTINPPVHASFNEVFANAKALSDQNVVWETKKQDNQNAAS